MSAGTLEVRGLTKRYGGLVALDGLDFSMRTGEILGLIGPNGAGKTTTFKLLGGAETPTEGEVRLEGEVISGLPPHAIARRGLARTFQHNLSFAGMTLRQNIMVGARATQRGSFWRALAAPGRIAVEEGAAVAAADRLIEFVGLSEFRDADVTTLSFGQGRLLELARALAGEPRFIMLDEPAAGLTPAECDRLAGIIRGMRDMGLGVVLIEHDMRFLLALAERVIVLNFGRRIAEGTPEEIRADPAVVAAYLGETRRLSVAAAPTVGAEPLLRVDDLRAGYGSGDAVQGISLSVAKGETVALLGPNGAGKSTFMAALTGTIRRRSGSARFGPHDLIAMDSHAIVEHGVALVPEGRRVFAPFTVHDNLRLGAVRRGGRGRAWLRQRFDFVHTLFPRLHERREQRAGTLSGGEQQMLAIGRALMSEPSLLLLDEPFLGLAPKVVEEIRAALKSLAADGLTLLLVEQKMDIALSLAGRAAILIKGRIALEDSAVNLAARDDLDDLYFSLAMRADVA